MKRTFILLSEFERAWAEMGLGDKELLALQDILLQNPEAGDVIPGLAGARKVRIPLAGRGKSGGGRVIYVDIVVKERIYLITAYAKNVREDLEPEQKKIVRHLVEYIKKEG